MKTILSLALALVVGLASAAPAAATPDTVIVSYADLDLNAEAGLARLDSRLERAVRRVCGPAFPLSPYSSAEVRTCRDATRASLRAQRSDAIARASDRQTQLASRGP